MDPEKKQKSEDVFPVVKAGKPIFLSSMIFQGPQGIVLFIAEIRGYQVQNTKNAERIYPPLLMRGN